MFARKVRALTAMGRASAYVLVGHAVLPLHRRSGSSTGRYVRPLWTQSAGHIMVLLGLVSMAIGGLVIRKIVNFKY